MTFFPYEYMKDNKPAGFDIEFLDGLAKVMGRQAVNIDTRFPNLITGLQSNRFDITNSSMYITADRMKVIDMIPYLKSGEAILSLKGSDYQPKTPEDFCGHKIGSMGATSWLQQLHKLSDDYCVKNGKPPSRLANIRPIRRQRRRCSPMRSKHRLPMPPWRVVWCKSWATVFRFPPRHLSIRC